MATFTAQLLIGQAHPNHGGINPTHQILLSENDRPAWIFLPLDVFAIETRPIDRIIWIPRIGHLLEDGLLLAGLHALQNPDLKKLAGLHLAHPDHRPLELVRDVRPDRLSALHERCRAIETRYKVALTLLAGSSLADQLDVLQRYRFDVEVCTPRYTRDYSSWKERVIETGSLGEG